MFRPTLMSLSHSSHILIEFKPFHPMQLLSSHDQIKHTSKINGMEKNFLDNNIKRGSPTFRYTV